MYTKYLGKDREGNVLRCGCICSFKWGIDTVLGVIIYNEHKFRFDLALIDKSGKYPSTVPIEDVYDTLRYVMDIKSNSFKGLKDYKEWVELYSKHVRLRDVNSQIVKLERVIKDRNELLSDYYYDYNRAQREKITGSIC